MAEYRSGNTPEFHNLRELLQRRTQQQQQPWQLIPIATNVQQGSHPHPTLADGRRLNMEEENSPVDEESELLMTNMLNLMRLLGALIHNYSTYIHQSRRLRGELHVEINHGGQSRQQEQQQQQQQQQQHQRESRGGVDVTSTDDHERISRPEMMRMMRDIYNLMEVLGSNIHEYEQRIRRRRQRLEIVREERRWRQYREQQRWRRENQHLFRNNEAVVTSTIDDIITHVAANTNDNNNNNNNNNNNVVLDINIGAGVNALNDDVTADDNVNDDDDGDDDDDDDGEDVDGDVTDVYDIDDDENDFGSNYNIDENSIVIPYYKSADNTHIICVICFDECNAGEIISQISCAHFYHTHCIKGWIVKSADLLNGMCLFKCPQCRASIVI